MENKPIVIHPSIIKEVEKIKKLQQEAGEKGLHVVYMGPRRTGRKLIQELLQAEDTEIIEPLKLNSPK